MKKALLVDDSTTLLMSIEGVLKKAGWEVRTATGGREALATLASYKPDLIITDLNMPGMDGITLIREIRKLPQTRFVPILMLTTESLQAKRQEAKAAGATGWLVKPVQANALMDVVRRVVPGA
ncbi:MAG TPA: response regulator [Chromatiales bacterium]|nr:response regulator [Chromatiales bacterium]